MNKKHLSLAEFYETYCHINKQKPVLREVDKEFFDMVDKAKVDGKNIIMNWGRKGKLDSYAALLTNAAMQLIEGNKVYLASQKPDKFLADLKQYFNIEVDTKKPTIKGKKQENGLILQLKQ